MVRTVKSHLEEEEDYDEEFHPKAHDASSRKGGESNDQKLNAHRSKHSETEQRRRSKINERFQVLRDLIPQNDQKRDKASFLLEVIQYIQFLQEKLQIYEGTYQGWSLDQPSKLLPWKNSCGPVDGVIDQSQVVQNGSLHEENTVAATSALGGLATYESIAALQPNLFEGLASPIEGSFTDALHMASQSQSRIWQGRPCSSNDCSVPTHSLNEQDNPKITSEEEASISTSYSQDLLSSLTHALKCSGVDVSQASISVQLDVAKQTNSAVNSSVFRPKGHSDIPAGNQTASYCTGRISSDDGSQTRKRVRMEQS